jgi:hypothetical protein
MDAARNGEELGLLNGASGAMLFGRDHRWSFIELGRPADEILDAGVLDELSRSPLDRAETAERPYFLEETLDGILDDAQSAKPRD